jgi:hypothetical protein
VPYNCGRATKTLCVALPCEYSLAQGPRQA